MYKKYFYLIICIFHLKSFYSMNFLKNSINTKDSIQLNIYNHTAKDHNKVLISPQVPSNIFNQLIHKHEAGFLPMPANLFANIKDQSYINKAGLEYINTEIDHAGFSSDEKKQMNGFLKNDSEITEKNNNPLSKGYIQRVMPQKIAPAIVSQSGFYNNVFSLNTYRQDVALQKNVTNELTVLLNGLPKNQPIPVMRKIMFTDQDSKDLVINKNNSQFLYPSLTSFHHGSYDILLGGRLKDDRNRLPILAKAVASLFINNPHLYDQCEKMFYKSTVVDATGFVGGNFIPGFSLATAFSKTKLNMPEAAHIAKVQKAIDINAETFYYGSAFLDLNQKDLLLGCHVHTVFNTFLEKVKLETEVKLAGQDLTDKCSDYFDQVFEETAVEIMNKQLLNENKIFNMAFQNKRIAEVPLLMILFNINNIFNRNKK